MKFRRVWVVALAPFSPEVMGEEPERGRVLSEMRMGP